MFDYARHIRKALYLTVAIGVGFGLSTMPPKSLTAQQVNINTLNYETNYGTVDVTAKFIPVAHVMIEHGVTLDVTSVEPASGGQTVDKHKDIYVSFVGGTNGDSVVVSCEVEANGTAAKTCRDADVAGPARQMVQAGDTLRSNLTVGPDVAETMRDKDMTVVISFSYI